MTGVRIGITAFVIVLMTLVAFGWRWTGANQPPAQALASQVVLAISALFGVVALVTIWRHDPGRSGRRS